MLTQRLWAGSRRVWSAPWRLPPIRRNYNASTQTLPHTTYFQEPPQSPKPPRRLLRSILFGTLCFTAGALTVFGMVPYLVDIEEMLEDEQDSEVVRECMVVGTLDALARNTPTMSAEDASQLLAARAAFSVTPTAVSHTCQSASNSPCEDTWSSGDFTYFKDRKRNWSEWAIFDGHAGARTSQVLKEYAPVWVGDALWNGKCMNRPYVPNDGHTVDTIKRAFVELDAEIVEKAGKLISAGEVPRAEVIGAAAAAFSGSCALLALFDPIHSVLRIANVGDSRAVLGRWDADSGKYIAKPMSIDQTGFNSDEVARITRDHPDETVVDPRTGRVHGLAVSRAFGDARWKWANDLTTLAHDKFWGPRPRPTGMIVSPPYLTAEPEVTETRIQTGNGHPDFLIMASDGLWDLMSSEDAVTCVQMWLDQNTPTSFLEAQQAAPTVQSLMSRTTMFTAEGFTNEALSGLQLAGRTQSARRDDDTYWDDSEQITKWRVSPKHFTVEDKHCGMHLIKNALGGKRKELFAGVMSVQPPLSRNIRDDITVHVIFFGVDGQAVVKN